MKRTNIFIAYLLSAAMLMSVCTGCGQTEDDGKKDNITLEEPVGVTADYDVVGYRNMYFADVFSSSVNPTVEEYAFKKDQTFKKYGVTPGGKVSKGDALVYSQTKDLDRQIRDLEEELSDFEVEHENSRKAMQVDIQDARKAEYEASVPFMELCQYKPDENSDAYAGWAAMALMPEGSYNRAIQNRERLEQSFKQSEELYALEHSYKQGNIERLRAKINDATIISDIDGEVVACNYYYSGDTIAKDAAVMAVGDTSARVLFTEYISKANISKALDIYAVIDGQRYELTYVNMEPEEYKQKSEAGESVYTTFILDDPSGTITIGTYAVVVMVKDVREQVLCVPSDSLKKESDGYYVYLYNGEESDYVPVQIGVKDGMYAEVLSGLSEGDKVLSGQAPKTGKNTAQVTRGDYSMGTDLNGFLYYPFSEWITNPVENGSVYFKEYLVSIDDRVEKDQPVCTIEVIPDQIEIDRLNRQLERIQSRLAKLRKTKADNDAKNEPDRSVERQIIQYETDINHITRSLSKLTRYSGIVEIKAPNSGMIMDLPQLKAGDLLYSGAGLAELVDDSVSYVLVKDDKNQLNYGNEAVIKVVGGGNSFTVNGKVVSVCKMCLSKNLTNDFSIIAVPQEEIDAAGGADVIKMGMWNRNSIKVNVTVRNEKNVLIVPKAAVTLKDKSTYVNVLKEDGTVETVSFIPGGSDNNNYWIVEGLTEGMTVCWE